MQQGSSRNMVNGSGLPRHLVDAVLVKSSAGAKSYAAFFLLLLLLIGAFISTRLLLEPTVLMEEGHVEGHAETTPGGEFPKRPRKRPEFPLNCTAPTLAQTCPRNYPASSGDDAGDRPPPAACPEYFRWIHEDLRPWARTGITREMVERAKKTANFRLVVVGGKAYMEKFIDGFQTRDVFTLWGFLQLLRRYTGKIPDFELMFDCVDWPVVKAEEYGVGPQATDPPPLFRYCGNDETLDIVFPDWSFWGWAEVNIKPWESLLKELKEGNERMKWIERQPYAYWKGNPQVAETRRDLMTCNVSDKHDWKARLYEQDWIKETKEGYKQSNLASQCVHRYKIYIEGSAWSVSEKYILACDSVTLLVKPHYYDFFTRGLIPLRHYWPIKEDDKCRSIKYAVEWGNSHKQKAQDIGKAASEFIQEELKMDYVYDYMFHLLNEYAKLLTFKPVVPENAVELCAESMACQRNGTERRFMTESLVKSPAEKEPCTMPPPYDPASMNSILRKKANLISKVEKWEMKYWDRHAQPA